MNAAGIIGIVGSAIGIPAAIVFAYFAVKAWRSSSSKADQVTAAVERAAAAELGKREAEAKTLDAEARAVAATAKAAGAEYERGRAVAELAREREEKASLYEQLAKSGAPGGGARVDHAVDRLYPDDHADGDGDGPGSGPR